MYHCLEPGDKDTYRRMAVNGMAKQLPGEVEVGFVDLWNSFVGKKEMYLRDGLHLSGKGTAVFADGLSGAIASGRVVKGVGHLDHV